MLLLIGVSSVYSQNTDTDGDGMPDAWETQYGLNPRNRFAANLDLDGDKIRNIDEFKAGTNPNDRDIDKNSDGVADDWMKFYGLSDANADNDGDGMSNKEEYNAGTVPTDPESVVKQETAPTTARQTPSMAGVRENIDASIPENHQVAPNVFRFNDPIGDDKGPGYYTYPTNPVYTPGAFDIVSFEVDATGRDNLVFKITVNADLKQDWGMAADFDVQMFEIYIDQDRVPGSGEVRCIPGINVNFDPNNAWDKVVIVSPQPNSRVQVELDVKAGELKNMAVLPAKVAGSGRTITVVVKRRDLGITAETDISNWAWQVVAQSNEGFPDSDDMLTRNVNEFRGLHRIGGGSDYWGDPELMDVLVWPARGTLKEAEDQFAILNVWESYPDPVLDVKAVLPLVSATQTEQWIPFGGYLAFAKALAEKIKPPVQRDKYCSDNFSLSVKVFTRYNWNMNPSYENFIKNSLEVQFYGKAFTDKVDFYMRWEESKWDSTIWTEWENDTPAQETISLQAFKAILVKPLPTIDTISIGNYELDYSPWVLGSAWYPDRDKFKGIFVDGSVQNYLDYHFTIYYPLNWIGVDWSHGSSTSQDFVYGLKLNSTFIKGLKITAVGSLFTDFETSPITSTNGDPTKYLLRDQNLGLTLDANYKLNLGTMSLFLGGVFTYTSISMGEDFKNLELAYEQDIDGNGVLGGFGEDAELNTPNETNGITMVGTLKVENILGMFNVIGQGFYIDYNYCALGSARGDTSALASGFGGSPTADILLMNGNQSVSRSPQAADFVSSVAIPGLPTDFLLEDPVTSVATIGWINDNWEGVAALGYQGATGILSYAGDILRVQGEFSTISYNNPAYTNCSQMRAFFSAEYSVTAINGKATLFGRYYSLEDGRKLNRVRFPTMIIPGISYEQQLGKFIIAKLQYKLEMGNYIEEGTSINAITNAMKYTRHRIGLNLNYSLPVGYIKLASEYWVEPSGAGVNDFTGRIRYGAFAITEWEFAF
jgi:hypothetical protein